LFPIFKNPFASHQKDKFERYREMILNSVAEEMNLDIAQTLKVTNFGFIIDTIIRRFFKDDTSYATKQLLERAQFDFVRSKLRTPETILFCDRTLKDRRAFYLFIKDCPMSGVTPVWGLYKLVTKANMLHNYFIRSIKDQNSNLQELVNAHIPNWLIIRMPPLIYGPENEREDDEIGALKR
jgi:hypothetical protein